MSQAIANCFSDLNLLKSPPFAFSEPSGLSNVLNPKQWYPTVVRLSIAFWAIVVLPAPGRPINSITGEGLFKLTPIHSVQLYSEHPIMVLW